MANFIKSVRQHFPTAKKSADEERDWVRSIAYILREYVASELAFAAETIIKTRETRGFPLPTECLKACAHARNVIRIRTSVLTPEALALAAKPDPEPGFLIWRKRDEGWRMEQLRQGRKLTEKKWTDV